MRVYRGFHQNNFSPLTIQDIVFAYCRTGSLSTAHGTVGLERLELRRLRMDLITCYNVVHGRVSIRFNSFLANVNSSRLRSLYVVVRPSVCLSFDVCRLSVCNVGARSRACGSAENYRSARLFT